MSGVQATGGLELPPQLEVERLLAGSLSGQLADQAVGAVVRSRIAAARAAASGLSGEGRSDEAVEAQVDAALLTEALDPGQAGRELQRLRPGLRSQAAR